MPLIAFALTAYAAGLLAGFSDRFVLCRLRRRRRVRLRLPPGGRGGNRSRGAGGGGCRRGQRSRPERACLSRRRGPRRPLPRHRRRQRVAGAFVRGHLARCDGVRVDLRRRWRRDGGKHRSRSRNDRSHRPRFPAPARPRAHARAADRPARGAERAARAIERIFRDDAPLVKGAAHRRSTRSRAGDSRPVCRGRIGTYPRDRRIAHRHHRRRDRAGAGAVRRAAATRVGDHGRRRRAATSR